MPKSYFEATHCDDKEFWIESMKSELHGIELMKVWEGCHELPNSKSALTTVWVYRIKEKPNNSNFKFKSRLCVQGFKQIQFFDYGKTHAPTGSITTICVLLVYPLHHQLALWQMDIKSAFLHAPLNKDIYIKAPSRYDSKFPYFKLNKALYGLKQAPKSWYKTLRTWLVKESFIIWSANPCLYINHKKGLCVFVYVDDLLIVGNSVEFRERLKARFSISANGPLSKILGNLIVETKNGPAMQQPNHMETALLELGLANCQPISTPITPNIKLISATNEDHSSFINLNINF